MNIKNISRLFGIMWIIISILWAALGIAGIFYGLNWLEDTQAKVERELTNIGEGLENVLAFVNQTTEIVSTTQQSLDAVQVSAHDTSIALADLRPLLQKTTSVVTSDVPDALDGVQESMPSMIETAKSMDETLTWLSNFELNIPNPFGNDWKYDLGISYAPDVPLDQALMGMSGNLEEVPSDLRDLDENLANADSNILVVSEDLAILAGEINTMNLNIQEIVPKIKSLAGNIEDIKVTVAETQVEVPESFKIIRKMLMAGLILLVITQIPSLYMGGLLVSGVLFPPGPTENDK